MRDSQFVRHLLSRVSYLEGKVAEQSATIDTLNKQRTVQATELQRVLAASVQRHSHAVASLHGKRSEVIRGVQEAHALSSTLYEEAIKLREHAVSIKSVLDALLQDAHDTLEAEANLHSVAQQHAAFIQRMDEGLPNGLADMSERQQGALDALCDQLKAAAAAKTRAQGSLKEHFDSASEHTAATLNLGLQVENAGSRVLKRLVDILEPADGEAEEEGEGEEEEEEEEWNPRP